jgi:hypothetical protein
MAWIDDESRWESGETGFGVGRTLYWLTTTIAAIIVVFAVADFFISWAQGAPIVRVFAFMAVEQCRNHRILARGRKQKTEAIDAVALPIFRAYGERPCNRGAAEYS